MFALEDLAIFDGNQNPQGLIFISLCGVVYDVSSAKNFYDVGKAYNVYAGRESARALGEDRLGLINSLDVLIFFAFIECHSGCAHPMLTNSA